MLPKGNYPHICIKAQPDSAILPDDCAACIEEARDKQWAEWILNRWIPSEGVGDLSREDFESLKKMAGVEK